MYIFVLAVQYLLIMYYLDGGFHEVGSQFVPCIFCRLSSSILKVSYLLHEHPVPFLAPTNHPQMKCEKTEVNNSFELTLDQDVPSIQSQSKILLLKRQRICSKRLQYIFCFFYVCYIFNSGYPKKLEVTFFYQFRSSHRRCSVKKGVLSNLAKLTEKHLCQKLFFNTVAVLWQAHQKCSVKKAAISKFAIFIKKIVSVTGVFQLILRNF